MSGSPLRDPHATSGIIYIISLVNEAFFCCFVIYCIIINVHELMLTVPYALQIQFVGEEEVSACGCIAYTILTR